jgi:hypothetical protein
VGTLLAIAIQQVPALLQFLKDIHQDKNPGAPVPSDAEVVEAYQAAFASSLAKDAAWLAQHPEPTGTN